MAKSKRGKGQLALASLSLTIILGWVLPTMNGSTGGQYLQVMERMTAYERAVLEDGGWEKQGALVRFAELSQRGVLAALRDCVSTLARLGAGFGGAVLILPTFLVCFLSSFKSAEVLVEGGSIILLVASGSLLMVVFALMAFGLLFGHAPLYFSAMQGPG